MDNTERKIKVDRTYLHFKGKYYKVLGIVQHHETKEQWVVYQAQYSPYIQYIRPLKEFMSKVDKDKYPYLEDEYRFEEVTAHAKTGSSVYKG
jgi:hypothetical protein